MVASASPARRPRRLCAAYLAGERVRAKVTEGGSEDRLAVDAVEVLLPVGGPCGSGRPPRRPGGAGGCDWQHVDLAAQRRLKGEAVAELTSWRLAGIDRSVEVLPVPGDVDGFGLAHEGGVRGRSGRAGGAAADLPARGPPDHAVPDRRPAGAGERCSRTTGPVRRRSTSSRPQVEEPWSSCRFRLLLAAFEIRERVESASWTGEFDVSARGLGRCTRARRPPCRPGPRRAQPAPGSGCSTCMPVSACSLVPLADAVGLGGAVLAEGNRVGRARNAGNRTWIEVVPTGLRRCWPPTSPDAWSSADLVVSDPPRRGLGARSSRPWLGCGAAGRRLCRRSGRRTGSRSGLRGRRCVGSRHTTPSR